MTNDSENVKINKPWYNFILHLHPRKVRQRTLRFTLTFGLGGMAALLVVIQVFTGLLLRLHYVPSPAGAYDSVLNITNSLLFGKLAHNIHHWSAIFLLWITFLHMLRVLFTGAYRKPRHSTWIFGIFLLIFVVLSNFTGYLLPWDQLSYWAVTVCTSLLQYIPLVGSALSDALLGGQEVSGPTLSNFFTLHTGIIPLILIILMAHHFWRIRKAGGLILSENDRESPMVDTQPNLTSREFIVALVLIASILLLSTFFDAPLRERANPAFSPNPAKAPWYFMGLQELLIHFHPFFAVVVIPGTILTGSFILPYIRFQDSGYGIWFLSGKGKKTGIISAVSAFLISIVFICVSEILPDPEAILPSIPSVLLTGFIPFVIVTGTIYFFLRFLQKKFGMNRSEYVQSLIIILVVSYTVLSLTGILFRGEGMALMWPWNL